MIRVAHEAFGVPIGLRLEGPETFEGGGFALLKGRTAVAGLCSRTTQGALDAVRGFIFDNDVADKFIEIRVPPDNIHIDGDFAELPGKTALAHIETLEHAPSAFHTRSEAWECSLIGWLEEEG